MIISKKIAYKNEALILTLISQAPKIFGIKNKTKIKE